MPKPCRSSAPLPPDIAWTIEPLGAAGGPGPLRTEVSRPFGSGGLRRRRVGLQYANDDTRRHRTCRRLSSPCAAAKAVCSPFAPGTRLTDRASTLEGLPFGPFDPFDHRTFELALREFVTRQTRFELGYVEQLYTFGDKGRDAPRADIGAGRRARDLGRLSRPGPHGGRDPHAGHRLVALVALTFRGRIGAVAGRS